MNYAIAVIDIGKTNKKVIIFDENLNHISSEQENFPSLSFKGVQTEDVASLESWIVRQLKAFNKEYRIRGISVTTHGASYACVDESGANSVPVIDYTYEPGDDFHEEFYRFAGSPVELQKTTSTSAFKALINPAKSIFLVQKRFPEEYSRTKHILFYPQYFGYRLTNRIAADYTYAGCHTMLWDYKKMGWSHVAEKLGIIDKLPARIGSSWEVLGSVSPDIAKQTGLNEETIVTFGVHDSNSSLIPYLIKKKEDFVLNSTGTWCVTMHPMEEVMFKEDELGRSVFFNLSVLKKPVKTAILLGGLEFETYTKLLEKITGKETFPDFDPALYRQVLHDKMQFILPGVVQGTGQFPESESKIIDGDAEFSLPDIRTGTRIPPFLKDFKKAYAVLNLSLAIQTKVALERVGVERGTSIYVEGGFRNNPDYNKVLSRFFPESKIAITNISEATSFGAAILAKMALEKKPLDYFGNLFEIEARTIETESLPGLSEYEKKFLDYI